MKKIPPKVSYEPGIFFSPHFYITKKHSGYRSIYTVQSRYIEVEWSQQVKNSEVLCIQHVLGQEHNAVLA